MCDLSLGNSTKMDSIQGNGATELFQAQSHIYNHIYHFVDSMALKCAAQLGIPDIIHNHDQPITLQELALALRIPPTKTSCLHRLMRLLVHSGFFATRTVQEDEGYVLTPSSWFLLKDNVISLSPVVISMLDPVVVTPWHSLGDWFRGNELTPFETAHGMNFWGRWKENPGFINSVNEAMASDSQLMSMVIRDRKEIFEGLSSVVDVGGGTGTLARNISDAFPHLKCRVLDLPEVVTNLPESENLKFVGGDMFLYIPPADAIIIKSVLHNWSDEDCIKVLKRCKEAIPKKVIIIDMVVDDNKDEHQSTKTKLFVDLAMMVLCNGRERNEKEWENLFLEAGFSHYKITPIFNLRSFIEVYP